jgi:dCMP deaminase
MKDWNSWFMEGVYWVASKSKDPKTKIGAIIVKDKRIVSTGYNGLPIGVDDTIQARNERPDKYKWYEHAERNAIYAAAKFGISTDGATLYTNALPCADCARGIIQSGITSVYVHQKFSDICNSIQREQWKGHDDATFAMFRESGVNAFAVPHSLGCKAFFDGKEYDV